MHVAITLPLTRETARTLKAGDMCLLSGVVYTARDAAHKRLCDLLEEGKPLPLDIRDATIYFVGPTPARSGSVIGSAGPTTAYRMDPYSPKLIEMGQTGMIGKGRRSRKVIDAMRNYGAVYFGAVGGCGALLRQHILSASVAAYEDLGTEAVRRLVVKDFPVVVIIDSEGNDLYDIGRKAYLEAGLQCECDGS